MSSLRDPLQFDSGCFTERAWDELAAGLVAGEPADRMLEHASECDRCAAVLKASIEIFGDASTEIVAIDMPRRPIRRPVLMWLAAVAALLVCVIAFWQFRGRNEPPLVELARFYSDHRTLELRLSNSLYGPMRSTRAADADPPVELLEIGQRISAGLLSNPGDPRWLRAEARLSLLEWKPDIALRDLNALPALEDADALDLATAHYQSAALRGGNGFDIAAELLRTAVEKNPSNAAAWFNLGLVEERLNRNSKAIEAFEKALLAPDSPGWKAEASQRHDQLRHD